MAVNLGCKSPSFFIFEECLMLWSPKAVFYWFWSREATKILASDLEGRVQQFWRRWLLRFDWFGALFLFLQEAQLEEQWFASINSIREATTAHQYLLGTSASANSGLDLWSGLSRSSGKWLALLVKLLRDSERLWRIGAG